MWQLNAYVKNQNSGSGLPINTGASCISTPSSIKNRLKIDQPTSELQARETEILNQRS